MSTILIQDSPTHIISNGEKSYTYKQLLSLSYELASKLKLTSANNRVLIFQQNSTGFIASLYAVWIKKGVAIPVDILSSVDDLVYLISDAEPHTIICHNKDLPTIQEAIELTAIDVNVHTIEPHPELLPDSDQENPPLTISGDDYKETALMIYTSGSTGKAKGVMLSFQNIIFNMKSTVEGIHIYRRNDRVLWLLPAHHIFSLLGCILIPTFVGCTIILAESFVGSELLSTIKNQRVSIIIGVPRLYSEFHKGLLARINPSKIARALLRISQRVGSLAFSRKVFHSVQKAFGGNMKFMVSGGAALPENVAKDLKALGFDILEGYGMTEASPMISFTHPRDLKLGVAGRILEGTTVKIKDGEIIAKGPHIMQGYWRKPKETNETIIDGWLHTGDLGTIVHGNYIKVTGRTKELIVLSNGKNITPSLIEDKLIELSPKVKEVAVVSLDDKLHAIFVVLPSSGSKIKKYIQHEVLDLYNASASSHLKIGKFDITTTEFPRTRIGKLKRHELPSFLEKNRIDRESVKHEEQFSSAIFDNLAVYFQENSNITVEPHDNIVYDLNIDSLDQISLSAYVDNTYGVKLLPHDLSSFSSLGELSIFIEKHKEKDHSGSALSSWEEIINNTPQKKLPKTSSLIGLLSRASCVLGRVRYKVTSYHVENVPEGPCILAPNHQSFLDTLWLTSHLPLSKIKTTYFYAKSKHVRGPLARFIASRSNVIVVDIEKDIQESIQLLSSALKGGNSIVIFPEGTRGKDGELGEFKRTFAILSKELAIPIVPISISQNQKNPSSIKAVSVCFHPAVLAEEGESYASLSERVRNIVKGDCSAANH